MNKVCVRFLSILKKQHLDSYSSCVALSRQYSYQSELSLEKLYPNSKQKIFTPTPPTQQKDVKFTGFIPMDQIEVTYSRSSGPGGQHVNRVNTKVDLRFKVETAEWIPEKPRKRFLEEYANKMTKDGYFVIKSDLTRSQQMNLADALEKIRCMIRELEIEKAKPTEETLEKIRRRQEKAARERLSIKRQRSQVKLDRQGPSVAI